MSERAAVGRRVRAARGYSGLSRYELAARAQLNVASLKALETGRYHVGPQPEETTMELGQIRSVRDPATPGGGAIHYVRPDRKPGCGDPCRPWDGYPSVFVPLKATTEKAALAECPESIGICGRNGCFPK